MNIAAADNLAKLWANYLDDAVGVNGTGGTSTTVGAFQLAVWEISYDHGPSLAGGDGGLNSLTLASGNFKSGNTLSAESVLAQGWLTSLSLLPAVDPADYIRASRRARLRLGKIKLSELLGQGRRQSQNRLRWSFGGC